LNQVPRAEAVSKPITSPEPALKVSKKKFVPDAADLVAQEEVQALPVEDVEHSDVVSDVTDVSEDDPVASFNSLTTAQQDAALTAFLGTNRTLPEGWKKMPYHARKVLQFAKNI
jgi:hypothetical protein